MLQLSQPANGHAVMRLSHPQGPAEPGDRGYLMRLKRKERLHVANLGSREP